MDTASVEPLRVHELIDAILDEHSAWSDGNVAGWRGYRNHAQRVYVFGSYLIDTDPQTHEQLAIAAAFHDLAVFRTLDYLVPNGVAAGRWLRSHGRAEWIEDIVRAMTLHHRVRSYTGPGEMLVEALRRADWVECTAGLVHPGIPRSVVRRAQQELPMRTFALDSGRRIIAHAVTHPADPFPFARSSRASRQLSPRPQ